MLKAKASSLDPTDALGFMEKQRELFSNDCAVDYRAFVEYTEQDMCEITDFMDKDSAICNSISLTPLMMQIFCTLVEQCAGPAKDLAEILQELTQFTVFLYKFLNLCLCWTWAGVCWMCVDSDDGWTWVGFCLVLSPTTPPIPPPGEFSFKRILNEL